MRLVQIYLCACCCYKTYNLVFHVVSPHLRGPLLYLLPQHSSPILIPNSSADLPGSKGGASVPFEHSLFDSRREGKAGLLIGCGSSCCGREAKAAECRRLFPCRMVEKHPGLNGETQWPASYREWKYNS